MRGTLTSTIFLGLLAATSEGRGADWCDHEAERRASVDAAGTKLLEIVARAGSLRVQGREGLNEIRVRGRACASDEDILAGIDLLAERDGERASVEALMPGVSGNDYARLDLAIEAPAGLAADIDDTSGAILVQRLGRLAIDDSSGAIEIRDIAGAVEIVDSSGAIDARGIGGDVTLSDSSGSIVVADVDGGVTVLRDSSGAIEVADVTGGVIVHEDSSGSISVRDVGGDFVVEKDSSGGVSAERVAGSVSVPRR